MFGTKLYHCLICFKIGSIKHRGHYLSFAQHITSMCITQVKGFPVTQYHLSPIHKSSWGDGCKGDNSDALGIKYHSL